MLRATRTGSEGHVLGRLGIAQRIYGSFGLLIVLLATVCVAAYLVLTSVIAVLSAFGASSGQAVAVHALVQQINALELAVGSYRVSRTHADADAATAAGSAINFDDPVLQVAANTDHASKTAIDSLRIDVADYLKAFAQSITLNDKQDTQVAAL